MWDLNTIRRMNAEYVMPTHSNYLVTVEVGRKEVFALVPDSGTPESWLRATEQASAWIHKHVAREQWPQAIVSRRLISCK